MIKIHSFEFNPFSENTYVLSDETRECIVIDPGCYSAEESAELRDYIEKNELIPVALINTHCHIDHMLGNKFVAETYKIDLQCNELELENLHFSPVYGPNWGIYPQISPEPTAFLKEGDVIRFGKSELQVYFTPGHSPGSVSLYHKEQNFVIAGDVLFRASIGRTDLPGGDHAALLSSIRSKMFKFDDKCTVYSGHGPTTTIGFEKKYNPFLIAP